MTRGEAERMRDKAEKRASAKIDIPSVYDEVRKAYAGMGYPVSGDRLVLSEQPTYVDGRPVPKDAIRPNSSGGNTQDDGTVRINPNYRSVMKHWGLKGSGRDFLRLIIGHELGHHVDRTLLRTRARSAERRRLLREIARTGFHTGYTDSYGPDTDPRKLDKELLAEYLAKKVTARLEKKAAAGAQASVASQVSKVMSMLMGGVGSATVATAKDGAQAKDVLGWTAATGVSASPMIGEALHSAKSGARFAKLKSLPVYAATVAAPAVTYWVHRLLKKPGRIARVAR